MVVEIYLVKVGVVFNLTEALERNKHLNYFVVVVKNV